MVIVSQYRQVSSHCASGMKLTQHYLSITSQQEIQNSPWLLSALHQTLPRARASEMTFLMSLSLLLVGQEEKETYPKPTGLLGSV